MNWRTKEFSAFGYAGFADSSPEPSIAGGREQVLRARPPARFNLPEGTPNHSRPANQPQNNSMRRKTGSPGPGFLTL
jgi:hypothetical protein